MWRRWLRPRTVISVIEIGQSDEWMEILDSSPFVAPREGDGPIERELREHLGDMLFLAQRLMREKDRDALAIQALEVEVGALRMDNARLQAARSWTRL